MKLCQFEYLYKVFLENDRSENCAKMLEEEFNKMFGIKCLNDKHNFNVVSILSMNIYNANDDRTSHDKIS